MEDSVKLTDTQLRLLSAASQRDDRALERPSSLTGGAAGKVVAKLLTEGLVEEIQSRGSLPVWRRDGDNAHTLRGYSRFCELFRAWEGRLSPTMRQSHVAGEKLFVDYAGTTLDVIDGTTGEVLNAQLFVAALGASSNTWAEATWTQGLGDWIGSHTRAFVFYGGVAAMTEPDNLKSGITKACFYDPEVNRSYAEMAAHYGTAIVPARPYKPRDKAKVEVAVLLATRWIIAKLRNRRFFSITELNDAIRDCVTTLNERVTRHLGASRRMLFEDVERTTLKPLPAEPYVYAEWKQCRVGLDYHVEVEKHFYSVPH